MRLCGNMAGGSLVQVLVAACLLVLVGGCAQTPAAPAAGGGDVHPDASVGDGASIDAAPDSAKDSASGTDAVPISDGVAETDAGSDASVPMDSVDGSALCPTAAPKTNGACTTAGLSCSFGQECCCGKCYPSLACTCSGSTWVCAATDACWMGPSGCPDASDAGPSDISQSDAGPSDGGSPPDTFDKPCNESSSSLTPCAEGQYCAKPEGQCSSMGKCKMKPTMCTKELNQQCGCDNVTYGNPCFAAAAGRAIQHPGPCKAVAGCVVGKDGCLMNEYCAAPEGQCSGTGTCTAKAQMCPMVYKPVCGCDGKTYGNSCSASVAGMVVALDGECPEVPGACDADTNSGCAKSQFCQAPAAQCGGKGVCKPYPQGCPEIWSPVCGCDGKTYGNDCEALTKGVNVATKGECTGKPQSQFYTTCGDPICKGWTEKGIAPCAPGQQVNSSCITVGETCDPKDSCNALLKCALSDPKLPPNGCPQ